MAGAGNKKKSNLLKVPFYVIAYNPRTLFSVEDEHGTSTLPVFTDAIAAEKYRQYFARKHHLKLQVCVADKLENGLNLIECATLACGRLEYAVIDPSPPLAKTTQPLLNPIQAILTSLLTQHRKGRSRRNPHKK